MSLRKRPLRPFAWFALVAFLCGWMLPFFEAHPLGFDDDTACSAYALVRASARSSAPDRIDSSDSSNRAPQHCLLCHLMRALNGTVTVDVARVSAPLVTASALSVADVPARSIVLSSCSSRGPPAA